MHISSPALREEAGGVRLTAAVRIGGGPARELWFQFPAGLAPVASRRADSFLVSLLPLAMNLGEPLTVEAPVSARLLAALPTIQGILARWLRDARRVEIAAAPSPGIPVAERRGTGCFFSGGVDSFYSLLTNMEGPGAVTHLVFVSGFDLQEHQADLLRQTRENIGRVARETGRGFIEVATNIRELIERRVGWFHAHGAALGSVALLFPGLFERVLVPSTYAYDELSPIGSHPLLDPLWSTEEVRVVHDGADLNRAQKITGRVARSDLALQTLRVCWRNTEGAYNCGRCEKCVRTMISLFAAGALDRCATFAAPLTPRLVGSLKIKNASGLAYAYANLGELQQHRRDPGGREITRALERVIRRHRLRFAWELWRGRLKTAY